MWVQELELVEDVWRGEAQDLLSQIAQLQEENKSLLTNLSVKDPLTEEDLQRHEGAKAPKTPPARQLGRHSNTGPQTAFSLVVIYYVIIMVIVTKTTLSLQFESPEKHQSWSISIVDICNFYITIYLPQYLSGR